MPPRFKFTREEIREAALDIVRGSGMAGLTARALAAELGCSVKPIFGLYKNMEEVQRDAYAAAEGLYQAYLQADMAAGRYPPYKASGMAYIRFAKEERALFQLLFMRDRRGEAVREDREAVRPQLELIQRNLGLGEDEAYQLHLEMWIYVHGIAAMVATAYLDWDETFVSRAITDVYCGLKHRFAEGKDKDDDPAIP